MSLYCTHILAILLIMLTGRSSAQSSGLEKFRNQMSELNPNFLTLYPDTLVRQDVKGKIQSDYSWPAGKFELGEKSFFYLSEFDSKAFENLRQGLITLEFIQGISLKSYQVLKGKPLKTPYVENCVHHQLVSNHGKAVGYSFACLNEERAYLILSSYPMSNSWLLKWFYEN